METAYRGTPTWLVALLVVFGVGAAATFGVFLARHAELVALQEQAGELRRQVEAMRPVESALNTEIARLEDQAKLRRERITDPGDGLAAMQVTAMADAERLATDNQAAVARIEAAYADYLETIHGKDGREGLMKDLRDRRVELGAAEEHSFTVERDHDNKRLVQREKVQRLQAEIEDLRKRYRGENVQFDARVDELEERVRRLTNQLDINAKAFRSDGTILESQARDGFVVIDRGAAHNLRRNTRFTVFNHRGGKIVPKGEIQVIRVEDDLAVARVVSEPDLNDPILKGDHIHNPVYDPAKIVHFAVAGDFADFSQDELKLFIRESGGVVDPELSTATDFLVAGQRATTLVEQASKLGVVILSERQLVEFVRPRSRFNDQRAFRYIDQAAREKRAFALKGRFTAADEGLIKEYIQSRGGTTTGTVDKGLAAVIVGEGAEDEMAKARTLGIPVIDQEHFRHLSINQAAKQQAAQPQK